MRSTTFGLREYSVVKSHSLRANILTDLGQDDDDADVAEQAANTLRAHRDTQTELVYTLLD